MRKHILLLILIFTVSAVAVATTQPVHAQSWGCGYWSTRYCYGYCGYGYGCYGYGYYRYSGFPYYYNSYPYNQYQYQVNTVTVTNTQTQVQVETVPAPPVFVTQTMQVTVTNTEGFLNSDTGFATLIFALVALLLAVIFGLLYVTRPTRTVEVPRFIQAPANPTPANPPTSLQPEPPSKRHDMRGFCGNCGQPVPLQGAYCSFCGEKIHTPN